MTAARFLGAQSTRWVDTDTILSLIAEAAETYHRRTSREPEAVYLNPEQPGYNGEPELSGLPVILTANVLPWSVVVGVKA